MNPSHMALTYGRSRCTGDQCRTDTTYEEQQTYDGHGVRCDGWYERCRNQHDQDKRQADQKPAHRLTQFRTGFRERVKLKIGVLGALGLIFLEDQVRLVDSSRSYERNG